MKCDKQRILYASLLKYGFDAHVFEILEDSVNVEQLNEREIYWINKLNSFYANNREFGMNLNKGGNTPIWDKNRIEDFSKRFSGNKNPFFGKKHSPDVLKKISENIKKRLSEVGFKISKQASEKGCAAVRKAIIVYDNNGCFVREFVSLKESSKYLIVDPTTIRDSLRGSWIRGKYLCKYKTENYPLVISERPPIKNWPKRKNALILRGASNEALIR